MSKFNELVNKLNEIFQIDKPDLDFGIYRILNARRDEINDYLNNRLKAKVEASLAAGASAQQATDRQQLIASIKEEFGKRAFNDAGQLVDEAAIASELGQKLITLQQQGVNPEDQQNQVFSHLLTFFSRYYDNGDFISQRRYKGDTYAIPYSGEEVVLHWANKDQYYIKSGENFSNYTIALADGRKVHFRLVSADTAKDNRKDNDLERRFVLIDPMIQTEIDEETGEESETLINPIEVVNGELTIRFAYKPMPKGTKQDKLNEAAFERLKSDPEITANWLALLQRAPTEKNPARTQLEKYLSDYTGKNSADYFIHKQLGKFLRGELDFYIKNEVMHLDDIQDVGAFAQIEPKLRLIQTLRSIAHDVIDFMAQLEDFQKKLWLKKKFVTETNYCITLDRVPESLYADIIANEQQHKEWVKLFAIDEIKGDMATVGYSKPLSLEFLRTNPFLVLDTAFFDDDFKAKLLNAIDNLDEQCDGLLIHSENFQALNLLQERYREQVKCIYIDPPYNTGGDGFIYKDGYNSSSWISMLSDRVGIARPYLKNTGIFFASLDDKESPNLRHLMKETSLTRLGEFVWKTRNADNRVLTNFSIDHESIHVFVMPNAKLLGREIDRSNFKNPDNDPRGLYTTDPLTGKANKNDRPNCHYIIENPETGDVYHPDPDFGWITDKSGYFKLLDAKLIFWPANPKTGKPRKKRFLTDTSPRAPISSYGVQVPQGEGNQSLYELMGYKPLNYPKPPTVLTSVFNSALLKDEVILDYFAGSGTTGHAVINLNREDNGKRKYILVEMGAHFDNVTKPRIQKVIYSKDWKDGKPVSREGISQCFKVLRLESYEDTLNNLNLVRSQAHNDLFANAPEVKEDYLLHYMLDIESKGSLLSVDAFKKPFDYTLNIAVDSAGAYQSKKIDLVETFNYLLGVRVKHINSQHKQGFVTVTGTLPTGETCLIIWRDTDKLDYEGISRLCDRLAINPADNEYDVVYLNGDHNIPTVLTQTSEEGGATRVLKLRSIESEFLQRMFSVEDV